MRRSMFVLAICGLLVTLARDAAPGEEERGAATVVERIREEALRSRPTWRLLQDLCRTAPHRLSGSEGCARAEEWAEKAMRTAGLENVRREPCLVPHWDRGPTETLEIHGAGDPEPLTILAIGGSVATPAGGITAEVIEARSFEELRANADRARGRIVFLSRPMDPDLEDRFAAYGGAVEQRVFGASEAAKVGAVAVVVRSLTTRIDDVPHTGTLVDRDGTPRIPAVAVSTKGAERLSALLATKAPVKLRLELACRWHEDARAHNVIGELRGREKPDEILVVGGHLDAWDVGEGAHDDGAGCCQSIAAAALLRELDLRPRRTIRVVLFANEENGSRGARAYVSVHEKELGRHVLALESDRGAFEPRGFTTNASGAALERLREIAVALRPLGIEWVRRGGTGADIAPLGRHGVTLLGFVPEDETYFDLHHSARDTLEAVNPESLERGTAAIAALLHAVADAETDWPRNPEPERDER